MLAHVFGHTGKEVPVQIRWIAVLGIGLGVTAVKQRPIFGCDLCAMQGHKGQARLCHLAAFLFDFFAFLLLELCQKRVEIAPSLVLPMKLNAIAAHQALLLGDFHVVGAAQQHMQGRGPSVTNHLQGRRQQAFAPNWSSRQQTTAWYRGEWHRDHGLGVIVQPMALIRLRPGPIEHVFAVRVVFQVNGTCGHQNALLTQGQQVQHPSGLGAGTSAFL